MATSSAEIGRACGCRVDATRRRLRLWVRPICKMRLRGIAASLAWRCIVGRVLELHEETVFA